MYIHVPTLSYPVKENTIKARILAETPNVSFAKPFIPPAEYEYVNPTDKPVCDAITESVVEVSPEKIDGKWVQKWQVVQATEEEMSQRKASFVSSVVDQTQRRLDEFVKTRGYDDTNSISKYKDLTDEEVNAMPEEERPLALKFRAESRYVAVAITRTWAKLYLILGEVTSGTRTMPTSYADVEPELPVLEWPIL